MSARRGLAAGAAALTTGLVLAVPALLAAPASAEENPGALLSLDGATFSASPEGAIFPDGVLLVPGSAETARIWVKNVSGGPASLGLALADASGSSEEFLAGLTLQAAVEGASTGSAVSLASPDACAPLLAGETLADGEVAEVALRLAMSADAGNEGQGATAGAKLAVSLTDASAGAAVPVDCTASSTPVLLPGSPNGGSSASGSSTTTGGSGISASGSISGSSSASSSSGTSGSDLAHADGGSASLPGDAPALPTLPFADHPAAYPGVIGAAAVLAAAAVILLLRKRKARHDGAD